MLEGAGLESAEQIRATAEPLAGKGGARVEAVARKPRKDLSESMCELMPGLLKFRGAFCEPCRLICAALGSTMADRFSNSEVLRTMPAPHYQLDLT